ncbi:MAG: cardiolipin synthase [Firmicutes bacterium]|nr:cardiolipin synthase [Bacillota bacterium]
MNWRKIKLILSKYGITALLIVVEVAGIVISFMVLERISPIVSILIKVVAFAAFISIVNRDTSPENKLPWITIVLISPLAGSIIYFIFFERRLSRKNVKHLEKMSEIMSSVEKRDGIDENVANRIREEHPATYSKAMLLFHDDIYANVYTDTKTEYFSTGEEMYAATKEDLMSAKNFIFLEFFIVDFGVMWGEMLDLLKAKHAEGVEIRMLYDDIGCMGTLPANYDRKLREMGIECYKFGRIYPNASPMHNNRDHRKIIVVDGKVGYTGGINLADEYINKKERFGYWKDGGIRLVGAGVEGLTRLFLMNWDLNQKTISNYVKYFKESRPYTGEGSQGFIIPFGSGPKPFYKRSTGKDLFLNMINQASDYVYITTPYLIIDNTLTEALQNAAIRGVDVRIITPRIPDKKLVYIMTRSSYGSLIKNGVKIYEFLPGFIHMKNVVSDDVYAVCGTINFDYRSFAHHFEDAVFMCGADAIPAVKRDFIETMQKSEKVERVKLTFAEKMVRDCVQLLVPLL